MIEVFINKVNEVDFMYSIVFLRFSFLCLVLLFD